MIRPIDRTRAFWARDRDLAMAEVQIQGLQNICARLHDDVAACDTNVRGAVFDIRRHIGGLHEHCPETAVFGIEDQFSRIGNVFFEPNTGLSQGGERGLQRSSFTECDHKHNFTALPERRSCRA